ncbi:hypothetical protein [Plantactinospora sp. CA-290183]|uniref:hypothetical protein n=1 Tax=Plantactinospora sp. CA-290183 TaxID=3240006 RepID=UPI003D9215F5
MPPPYPHHYPLSMPRRGVLPKSPVPPSLIGGANVAGPALSEEESGLAKRQAAATIVLVAIPDETYRRYFENGRLAVDWDRAAQVVRHGEPAAGFFTLPWWQTESRLLSLYGSDYNKERLTELRRLPMKRMFGHQGWRTGILYPGVPDEWTPVAVGVMTQAGHVGCVAGDVCTAGLGNLVRALDAAGEYFAVPLHVSSSDVAVLTPDGRELSAFDYPWAGKDSERHRAAARLNRSHVLGLLMLKHGPTVRWRSLAERISVYGEDSGVTVGPTLPLFEGSRVMVSLRDDTARMAIQRASELVGFEFIPRPKGIIDKRRANEIGKIDALITTYPESGVPICEYARRYSIPIYRPDEFVGGLAEAVLHEQRA